MEDYFEELKAYMRFDAADHKALQELHPLAKPHFSAIADDFYECLRSIPSAVGVFRSEDQVLRLQATLARWMDRLLSGPWGEDYFELRSRIGKVHVQIQLPQQYMFSEMAAIQEHLLAIAWQKMDKANAEAACIAVQKITNIDLAIMLETYRVHFVNRVRSFERREMHSLETKLEHTEALYRSIFESSGVAIVIVDGRKRVRLLNREAEQVTGFKRELAMGQQVSELLVHPREARQMSALLEKCAAGLPCGFRELRLVAADTSDKWIRWHPTAIEGSDDICMQGIDVTRERKLAAQTRRVETLAALGTLAAGLAHEIRNPLNAAQLQLMLVERSIQRAGDAVDPRALDSSALVKSELNRLAGLVGDFLAFARPSDLRVDNADVSQLCAALGRLLASDAESANVELTTTIEPGVVARVDAERLKQVLINLLRNAIEATGKAGHVGLMCHRIGQSVFFSIEDDGPGIPEGIDIFEPFATSKEAGTGLGLPIVHRIVTDHDGSIDFRREDAKTVFTVELPIDGPNAESL